MDYLVCFPGNANDPSTFGGATYFLREGFISLGLDAAGIDLTGRHMTTKRLLWNAKEFLLGKGIGGFQYSDMFLREIYRGESARGKACIVNMFQLYDPRLIFPGSANRTFYIDQTLSQLFKYYPDMAHMSSAHKIQAIAKERAQYQRVPVIFCMCEWAARSVQFDYGISREKICVVLPGANVNEVAYNEWERAAAIVPRGIDLNGKPKSLRLIFVGKDPLRKGLQRLLAALKMLPDLEPQIKLTVIGCTRDRLPAELQTVEGVDWYGHIDKFDVMSRFLELVGSHDIGVLLSTAEATGLSLREFQLLGLGVIAPDVGGAPDMLIPGAGILVSPSASSSEIAGILRSLHTNRLLVNNMRLAAWQSRRKMLWRESALYIHNRMCQINVAD